MREQNIIGIDDLDTPIYRIFTIRRLLEVFQSKQLTLVKPAKWDDPFENFLLKSVIDLGHGDYAGLEPIQQTLYAQCWTTLEESDAIWRIYAPKKNSVRVKTTVRELWDAFYNPGVAFAELSHWLGRMEYMTSTDIQKFMAGHLPSVAVFDSTGRGHALSLLVKRIEFNHEQEVRVIYNDSNSSITGDVHPFRVDPLMLFHDLLFDPRMSSGTFRRCARLFKKQGFTRPMAKSSLYSLPSFVIKAP
jgi:hypothetical protein